MSSFLPFVTLPRSKATRPIAAVAAPAAAPVAKGVKGTPLARRKAAAQLVQSRAAAPTGPATKPPQTDAQKAREAAKKAALEQLNRQIRQRRQGVKK